MIKTTIYLAAILFAFLTSCNNDQKVDKVEKVDNQERIISPLCSDSDSESTLRLEVKCDNCEVKYRLMKDEGKEENKESIQGVWCKELTAKPTDIVGLFATKLEGGEPIDFTLESIKFKEGVDADTVEVRAYYNNRLIKQSDGDGYAGISMLEIPTTKFEAPKSLNLKESIGRNLTDVVQQYSKSNPETLSGTNNEYWIVYYKDIDVTFTVIKESDVIEKAKKGRK